MKKLIAMFALLLATPSFAQTTITVDNEDPGFSITDGTWTPSTFVSGFLGGNYLNTGDTTTFSQVQWALDTVDGEEYDVSARWSALSNRTSSAIYTITHANGISQVTVNQRENGGQFVSLGTYVSPTLVQLTNEGIDGFVVADSVQATPLSEVPVESSSGAVFGEWQHPFIDGTTFLVDTIYEAPSDGIVTNLTGGNCTNYYAFDVGFSADNVNATLGQIAQNGGFTAPVKKGMFWRLRRGGGSNAGQCSIIIGFLPLLGGSAN